MNAAVERFVSALGALDAHGINGGAEEIRRLGAEPAEDIAWWRATMAVDRQLAAHHRLVAASAAARAAAAAVESAARDAGLDVTDPDVVLLTRRARDVARAMLAGAAVSSERRWLMRGWWAAASGGAVDGAGSAA